MLNENGGSFKQFSQFAPPIFFLNFVKNECKFETETEYLILIFILFRWI